MRRLGGYCFCTQGALCEICGPSLHTREVGGSSPSAPMGQAPLLQHTWRARRRRPRGSPYLRIFEQVRQRIPGRSRLAAAAGTRTLAPVRGLRHPRASGDVALPGIPERLYLRLGGWYWQAMLGAMAAFFLFVAVPLYSALLIPYFGATRDQYATVVLSFAISILVAGIGLVAIGARRHRALIAWAGGRRGPDAAVAAWNSIVGDLPRSVLLLSAWYSVCCIPPALYVSDQIDLSAGATAGYCVVLFVLVGGMAVPAYLIAEQALRPIAQEVAAALPDGTEPRLRPVSLGLKMLILLPSISLFTSMVVAGVSSNSSSLEGRIALTVLTALVVNATVSLGLTLLLRRALVRRLDDLREALVRVDRGDLTVRLLRLAGDELAEVGRSFNQMVGGLREREALHGALSSYVSADLADRIAAAGAVVEGEQVEVTVLFVDIRDFTWLVDHSEPSETVVYLNDFFDLVLPIITAHGGHPNKLLGDGLLAVFGAPVPLPGHAACALAAGRELLEALYARYEGELRVGIGLNSGPVIAGTVGGPGKLDYTVIGDTVNVAARVEQLTKETGDALLLTDATRLLLTEDVALEDRGQHRVRGKAKDITVYAVDVPLPVSPRKT